MTRYESVAILVSDRLNRFVLLSPFSARKIEYTAFYIFVIVIVFIARIIDVIFFSLRQLHGHEQATNTRQQSPR